jgi:DNA-binding LacI/PurR family transcriptional regulator
MTQKEIAEKLNMSRATVSHALNNRKGVNEETKRKVLEVADKLNYRSNIFALSMRSKSSNFIGNIFRRGLHVIENHSDLIQKEVDSSGYHCMNINMPHGNNNENILNLLYSNFFDGIIVNLNNPEIELSGEKISSIIKKSQIPSVFYGTKTDLYSDCHPAVVCDIENGYKKLTEFLLKKGAERFVFIGSSSFSNKKKFSAVKQALAKHGVKERNLSSFMPPRGTSSPFISGLKAVENIDISKVDAAICANDIYATGFINEATRRGVKVPEQIKVTGCDNLQLADYSIIPITSINTFNSALIKKTMKKLLDVVNNKDIKQIDIVSPQIIERDSTG